MRILYCGDVVGAAGRQVVLEHVPVLRMQLQLDFVIVNGENATHGFGITAKTCDAFYKAGVDVITLGNHAWDQREIITYIDKEVRLLRPLNYPAGTPGRGAVVYNAPKNRKILVAQVMGRLFMDTLDDPFAVLDALLKQYALGKKVQAIIIDVHGEATSEKMAIGHFADGRASLVVGSHTHVPTADAQILPRGTAYQTDAGMCGDYNSVIGLVKEQPLLRFTRKMPTERLRPAGGEGTLCGVYVETDEVEGHARVVCPLRLGGRLQPARLPPT
ncbi:FIG006542: Phosphoesterase [invertebrate metagenome]|uniref:FIG006542: Phosphoesterase n=1 Tax=invertebrate metagenome TaxID=1711999 RepID=A0A484H758_9ZZZZ